MKYLLAGLFLACTLAAIARSQTLQPEPVVAFIGTNGLNPQGNLVQAPDGNLYGTTVAGGTNGGFGTVFKITTTTGALTTLVNFNGTNGANPSSGLTLGNDGNLYGTTTQGGTDGGGTVFRVTTGGMLVTLFNFNGPDSGADPGGLVLGTDGNFYGTTRSGNYDGTSYGYGTVFKITPSGVLTTLTVFSGTNGDSPSSDATLTFGKDGNLYGVTLYGGASNYGTVFKVTTNGALTSLVSFNNSNGAYPNSGLALGNDGQLYGTTSSDALGDYGTIFKVTTNGVLTPLFVFNSLSIAYPVGRLTLSSNGNFYGTTLLGGSSGLGTIFQMTTNGFLIPPLLSFNGTNGASPHSGLTLASDGNFYGATYFGGNGGEGTVFKVTKNGILTTLTSFVCNGANPNAALTVGADGNFYGTTSAGGTNGGWGTVFRINKTDNSLTTLLSFDGTNGGYPTGLALSSSGDFYGTTYLGGANSYGTIFKITTNGVLTTLASFYSTNGGNPYAGLIFGYDGSLYGTTYRGGTNNLGTVFKVTTSGVLTVIASFNNANGANPHAALTLGNDGVFYGTTEKGGTNGGWGTVYKVTTSGVLTSLVSFDNNLNGAAPYAPLVLGNDGNFYGTTAGYSSGGTVFRVTPAGIITTLYSLDTWNDGSAPYAGLTPWVDGCFYGTTSWAGYAHGGTIFKVTPGGQFTSVAFFPLADPSSPQNYYQSGYYPNAALTPGNDGNFYGTTSSGGIGGLGTIFRLSNQAILPPGGIISSFRTSGSNPLTATLTWLGMTNTPYILQYTTNLSIGPWINLFTNIPNTTGAWTNIDSTATNFQRFYRLKH